jgi:patatin-related protein
VEETRTPTRYAATQEIRFAVVMYGGVSLAIYINGVAQELLQLVKATAPRNPGGIGDGPPLHTDEELKGTTAAVYRELGQMLRYKRPPAGAVPSNGPILTRFVVDVISGTSAGGINGVFLAKALANDQPIKKLKQLWVDEGDIAELVNDRRSYEELNPLRREAPPEAALNGTRMYWKLLEALDGMELPERGSDWESPLVDELDLWVTTTDLRGVTVPLDLYDRMVFEKRHRKVFRFLYRGTRAADGDLENHFRLDRNPMLAFAARCTSSFPFAFEPVQLLDVDRVLRAQQFRNRYAGSASTNTAWKALFSEYLEPNPPIGEPAAATYRNQSFADGGYLDNRPFSWATGTLDLRRADRPVDRRLIYIEPDPDSPQVAPHPPGRKGQKPPDWGPLGHVDPNRASRRPDALENVRAAMTSIPRHETIREDLERILARNRDVDRIRDITDVLDDVADLGQPIDFARWRAVPATKAPAGRGLQYLAYERLRVAATADDLAALITHLTSFDAESDEYSATRCLVQAWLDIHHPPEGEGEHSQREFLARLDFAYRVRRIDFLQKGADELIADASGEPPKALLEVKETLSSVLVGLRAAGRQLRGPSPNPVRELVKELGLTRPELLELLNGATTKKESVERARELLRRAPDRTELLTRVMDSAHAKLKPAFDRARDEVAAAVEGNDVLRKAFDYFELYDSIYYPIAYGNVDEADRVEVIRISPLDADSIVKNAADRRHKLAGLALHHFGGFFDRSWRRNDILWGRLDAAERILTTLLDETPERDRLLEKAQLAIIKEEIVDEAGGDVLEALVSGLLGRSSGASERKALKEAIACAKDPAEILKLMKEPGYATNHRELDPASTLETAGRLVQVTGEILQGVSNAPAAKQGGRWVARIGRFVWGMVELAMSRSMVAMLWRWWAQLLVVVAALMIVGGAILGEPGAVNLGWILLLVVLAVKVTGWVVRELTGTGTTARRMGRTVAVAAIAIVLISTVWAATTLARAISEDVNDWACDLPWKLPEWTQTAWPLEDSKCSD